MIGCKSNPGKVLSSLAAVPVAIGGILLVLAVPSRALCAGEIQSLIIEPDRGKEEFPALAWLGEKIDITTRVLTFGFTGDPIFERIDEDVVPEIIRHRVEADVRPNVLLSLGNLTASIKPRFDIWRQRVDREGEKHYETDSDLYVNEWLLRYAFSPTLFASYSRENLQWGPSYLLSPSNPFNSNNGRNNPKQEVPGMDFVTLVWAPNRDWTISFIANIDEGRRGSPWNAAEAFDRAVATAEKEREEAQREIEDEAAESRELAAEQRLEALGAIRKNYRDAVRRVNERRILFPSLPHKADELLLESLDRLHRNLRRVVERQYEDALRAIDLMKAEAEALADNELADAVAVFDEATRELREFRNTYALKVDWLLFRKYLSLILSNREGEGLRAGSFAKWDISDALVLYGEGSLGEGGDVDALGGLSYTLKWGPTLFGEYYYNSSGESYAPPLEIVPPFGAVDIRDILLRRNYALFQFVEGETFESFDLALRWIFNLDDGSNRMISQLLVDATDYLEFFLISALDSGGEDDEFGSLFRYSVSAGMEFTF
jgi:hypothetical protein